MKNSNLYVMTRTTYEENPPSFGGNWERGEEITVAMSRAPKFACQMNHYRNLKRADCIVTHRHTGVVGVPVLVRKRLTRGSAVIFDRWD